MFETVKGLTDYGHHVLFYVFRSEISEDYRFLKPLRLRESILSKLEYNFIALRRGTAQADLEQIKFFRPSMFHLIHQLQKDKPDVVIVRDSSRLSMRVSLACKLLGIQPIIKYSQVPLFVRKNLTPSKSAKKNISHKFNQWLQNSLLPRISYTPVETRDALDFLANRQNYIKRGKKYFIPLIAKAPDYNIYARTYCRDGKIRVMDVGKYRQYKNHELFIDAIAKIPSAQFEFTIVGQCTTPEEKAYYNQLTSYIDKNHLTDRVHLLQNLSFAEMETIYLNSDALVLSSLNETAAVCILEAMSHGVIPISPDTNGTATYIDHTSSGYIYRAGDPVELSEIILGLADNIDNIRKIGIKAYERYCNFYSFDAYFDNLKNLLKAEFDLELSKSN